MGPIFQISNSSENLGCVVVIAFNAFKTVTVSTSDETSMWEENDDG